MEQTTKITKQAAAILCLVIFSSVAMAVTETLIEPPYALKSLIKGLVFLLLPLAVMKYTGEKQIARHFMPGKKGFLLALGMGAAVYGAVMLAYVLTKNVFDYAAVVDSLSADQSVNNKYFVLVALYICLGNSLLEEFMFRVTAFLRLRMHTGDRFAYLFSAAAFALYHIAMLAGSFPLPMLLLSLFGLAAGGLIFDFFDSRNGDIYRSWLIHMGADIAIMHIWWLMIPKK